MASSVFTVTIEAAGKVLTCAMEAAVTSVTLRPPAAAAAESKRQQWKLTPAGSPDTYVVTCAGREGLNALTALESGGLALCNASNAPDQQWQFKQIGKRIFTIARSSTKFLTNAAGGALELRPRKAPAGGAATQQFKVLDVAPPSPAPMPASPTPVYLGGAFEATTRSLAFEAAQWSGVASKAGYWAHPMGVSVAKNGNYLPALLARFGVKKFVYEADLLAWSDGTNPLQTNTPSCWADWIRQADPSFQCEFYAPWVEGNRVVDLTDDTVNRYAQIRGKMDAAGYGGKGYFFTAPPSPDSIGAMDRLLSATRNGLPIVEYVVKTAGLRGIALDFPAGLWLAAQYGAQFPPNSADKCRRFAKMCFDITKKMGVPYVQVFNGVDVAVAQALESMKAAGIVPDMVCVDNFGAVDRSGVPETDPNSVSGQAKSALDWLAKQKSGLETP